MLMLFFPPMMIFLKTRLQRGTAPLKEISEGRTSSPPCAGIALPQNYTRGGQTVCLQSLQPCPRKGLSQDWAPEEVRPRPRWLGCAPSAHRDAREQSDGVSLLPLEKGGPCTPCVHPLRDCSPPGCGSWLRQPWTLTGPKEGLLSHPRSAGPEEAPLSPLGRVLASSALHTPPLVGVSGKYLHFGLSQPRGPSSLPPLQRFDSFQQNSITSPSYCHPNVQGAPRPP